MNKLISMSFYSTDNFREKFFPQASKTDWDNWKWQLRNQIKTPEKLNCIFKLSDTEFNLLQKKDLLPTAITPYYAAICFNLPELRRTVIPSESEYDLDQGECADPLNEIIQSPTPNIVHRYPDRVLFLTTHRCASYCRYCTRKRLAGQTEAEFSTEELSEGFNYIKNNSQVREILFSGGDFFTLSDKKIKWLLEEARAIEHIEIIRVSTKAPIVLPQRFTPELIQILKSANPLILGIHSIHPAELITETTNMINNLADAGIMLGSQTVLLKGINNSPEVIKNLMLKLLKNRIRPYHLYQCDLMKGTKSFRTDIAEGLEIMRALRGHISSYAVPEYIIDPPDGAGKINLVPDGIISKNSSGYLLKNWRGEIVLYPESGNEKIPSL